MLKPQRLKFAQVEKARQSFQKSILLFLTDKCPVGCDHCSVDSRPDSPSINNFKAFDKLLNEIAALPEVDLVGISGGEPFVERRGLTASVTKLRQANKLIVIYTSGIWARQSVAPWIEDVLAETSTVFLSTDAYHSTNVSKEAFVRAARTISAQGTWLIVQVLEQTTMVDDATKLLVTAFGPDWNELAELHLIPPLPYGRGKGVFTENRSTLGSQFGPCLGLSAPVVRYDGQVTACCNEQIIKGLGPDRLRRQLGSDSLAYVLDGITRDPFLQSMRTVGAGAMTAHPKLDTLATERFQNICSFCWKASDRLPIADSLADPVLSLLPILLGNENSKK